jgi:hypothetical protein
MVRCVLVFGFNVFCVPFVFWFVLGASINKWGVIHVYRGAMDVTKPYKFIRFGAMDVTKPYKFIGFGARGDREMRG